MYKMADMELHYLPFSYIKYKTSVLRHLRLAILLVLLLVSCSSPQTQVTDIRLSLIANGFSQPVDITHAGDKRVFIVEKTGHIRLIERQSVLDISERVSTGNEQGLLGLAFDPNFKETNYFFVNYTDTSGTTTISRFTLNNETSTADPQSEKILLTILQPYANHNGGQIAFGPDGYLYIATGDGGSANDPLNAGQDLNSLLGKILRIDVNTDATQPYLIPEDNPFIGRDDARPEIWSYGLRNPWRMSFDKLTGDLYIGDVGQNNFEEVNFQAAVSKGGENYGWRLMEAKDCFNPPRNCNPNNNLVQPILSYTHNGENGQSVTGGYVYRGISLTHLSGVYIYGDFVSGRIWQAIPNSSGVRSWRNEVFRDTDFNISTFGTDSELELYVASYSGSIYKFVKE